MDISEVVKQSGLPASTLRFYEEKGLIASLGQQGERRRFAPQVIEQLAVISLGQSAGFSLDEIRLMFAADGQLNIDRQLLLNKAEELDATIRRLKAMSSGLRHAAVCPAPDHGQCPTFQRLLKAAAQGTQTRGLRKVKPGKGRVRA